MTHTILNGTKMLAAVAFLSGTAVAFAAVETVVTQKGKVFSQSEMTIKAGDTVLFFNDDVVVHNVISNSPGNEFNLGSMRPGTSNPVTFKTADEVQVICAIHPYMSLHIKVTP